MLPGSVRKRMVVEAAESFSWHRFIGLDGATVTMDRFGASAPGGTWLKEFGFTLDNVGGKSKILMGQVLRHWPNSLYIAALRKKDFLLFQ